MSVRRVRRSAASIVLAAALAACSGGGGGSPSSGAAAPTPASHAYFPIATGHHAVGCAVCHGTTSSYAQFDCLGCHAEVPTRAVHDRVPIPVAGFAYDSLSCYRCHADPTVYPFDHEVARRCDSCHQAGQGFPRLPLAARAHPDVGALDCASCHVTSAWASVSGPPGLSGDPSQAISITALVPHFSGSSIASVSPTPGTLPMPMDHGSAQSTGAGLACGDCHAGAAPGAFPPGRFHAPLASHGRPPPTACADCHATSVPAGFVGPLAASPARQPPSGEMRHDAVAWSGGVPTSMPIVTLDCAACHASPAALPGAWSMDRTGTAPARFHASLDHALAPQPGSCLDCHANGRPGLLGAPGAALSVGLSFDHGAAIALGDCAACHTSVSAWTGGRLHHPSDANPGSCLPCHAGERPTSTAGWVATGWSGSPFDYAGNALGATHGDGLDCAVCHAGPGTGASWGASQTWAGGHFTHGPATASATTCAACHESQRPDRLLGQAAAAAALGGFDHAVSGTADCFSCHQATVTRGLYVALYGPSGTLPGGDWAGGGGAPSAPVGDPARAITVTAQVPHFSGTSIASVSSVLEVLDMPMSHASAQSTGTGLACADCHATAPAGVFFPGRFHSTLASHALPAPTACADCHTRSTPTGFVGPLATSPARQPPSAEMRHDAVVWSGGVPTTTPILTLDCAACHASPTAALAATWAMNRTGTAAPVFHASLGAAAVPQPGSCLDCHANGRPGLLGAPGAALPSGVSFDHGAATAVGDCAGCHASVSAWAGGRLHHATDPNPASCVPCHAGERPTSTTGWVAAGWSSAPFDYGTNALAVTHGDGQDCAVCHQGPGTGGSWGGSHTWAGGRFTHGPSTPSATTCGACHQSQRPDRVMGQAAAAAALGGFDHAVSGTADCFSCHQATVTRGVYVALYGPSGTLPGGDWSGGVGIPAAPVADPAQAVTVAALVPRFSGTSIAAVSPATEVLPMPMSHASAQSTGSGLACADCHATAPAGVFFPGRFHASLASHARPAPTACADCHATSVPTGFVGPLATSPSRQPPSGEMRHDAVAWSGGVPTTTPIVTLDCAACHASPTAALKATWATGRSGAGSPAFHASLGAAAAPQPGSCLDCHANGRPGLLGAPAAALPAGLSFDHGAAVALGDCAACHASFSAWTGGLLHHAADPSPASCAPCHAGERPTSTTGWTAAGWSSSPFDYGTNPLGTTHGDGQDCAVCHTGPGTGGSWGGSHTWTGGHFTHGPSTPSATTCGACHQSQRPDRLLGQAAAAAALGGFDHAVSGTADCFSCHQATVTRGVYVALYGPSGTLPGGDWAGGVSAPSGLVADPAHAVTVVALVPRFSGTSIAAVSAATETLPMPMSHASAQATATGLACADCHAIAAAGVFFPGRFHSTLANHALPAPTACADCHATSAPTGFVGPLATSPARQPPSGEMRHDAVAWSGGVPTSTALVTHDCAACHASPTAALAARWSTGRAGAASPSFHASLGAAAAPQPGSCLDCHANGRPGVLSAPAAALPAGLSFDHGAAVALGDCTACHASVSAWTGGLLHHAADANPASCLPCHAGERPTSTTGWVAAGWSSSPFDYGTNALGATHGDGQDCALCHPGPGTAGSWGGSHTWAGGHFTHGTSTPSATTCGACHQSQRPDRLLGQAAAAAALGGFDHAVSGTGDCIGCHQATVTRGVYVALYGPSGTLPGGDWAGGAQYPGATLVAAPASSVTVPTWTLLRSGGVVTGVAAGQATLPNPMLHVSAAIPAAVWPGPAAAPDPTTCWHCHLHDAQGSVTSWAGGVFHASLAGYAATPGGTVTPLAQPAAGCGDCHVPTRPPAVVEGPAGDLVPMDHAAAFTAASTFGGQQVADASALDCSVCHAQPAGWSAGSFHGKVGATAVPAGCVACHYPLMADPPRADVASAPAFAMSHRSPQVPLQACDACHASALARAVAATGAPAAQTWQTGAFHATVPAQPRACLDCHAVSEPSGATQSTVTYVLAAGGTATNGGQWMNHAAPPVAAADCAACHASDARASGAAWSPSTAFHAAVASPGGCAVCHGLQNGNGAASGTGNNVPFGLTSSSTATSAALDPATGVPPGTLDQLTHDDVNVTSQDCAFCHLQVGPSSVPGVQGAEWAQASFHASFSASVPLVLDGLTGRCSNCHLNVVPGPGFTAQDHSGLSSVAGTQDCAACHSWPGTGTPQAPNWLGASNMPQLIAVGGFTIPQPPAAAPVAQAGIANLPHPTPALGETCAACHTGGIGGKGAIGYDHVSPLGYTNCGACHEAGSPLVGTTWNQASSQAAGLGDTRPYTLPSIVAPPPPASNGSPCTITLPNHFYPVDCSECHGVPAGTGATTTGAAYGAAWTFLHGAASMTNPSTCNLCHVGQDCRALP